MTRRGIPGRVAPWSLCGTPHADAPGAHPPWAIGHRSVTFVDPARNDRPILSKIHYPAFSGGDDVPPAEPDTACEWAEIWAPDTAIERGATRPALTMGALLTWRAYELKGGEEGWWAFEEFLASSHGITFPYDPDAVPPAPPRLMGISSGFPAARRRSHEAATGDTTRVGQTSEAARFCRETASRTRAAP